jgi:hypothetical protein
MEFLFLELTMFGTTLFLVSPAMMPTVGLSMQARLE